MSEQAADVPPRHRPSSGRTADSAAGGPAVPVATPGSPPPAVSKPGLGWPVSLWLIATGSALITAIGVVLVVRLLVGQ